jgi:hypothetical protein
MSAALFPEPEEPEGSGLPEDGEEVGTRRACMSRCPRKS